ncbi:MAG: UbiA family prenyltransferase, partial [Candidatus Aenigmatarchaeota archaeon]
FVHYYVSYIALAMLLILLFYIATRTDVIKIARVVLPSFIILNLAPLLDLIISQGKGYKMTYMLPGVHDNLILRFFTFFGDFTGQGITPGQRIEIALVLLGSLIYFYIKNSNLIKSLFYTLLTYTLLFILAALPIILNKVLGLTNMEYMNLLLTQLFLLIIFVTGIILSYLINRDRIKIFFDDIRPWRLLHFELMFALGLILGMDASLRIFNITDLFNLMLIAISIAFAWLYALVSNNIHDYEIDKISNKERPLIKPKIGYKDYKRTEKIFPLLALFYAVFVNFQTLFFILLSIGTAFLYSVPPLRLKRIPFFSKLFISLGSLLLVMLGFTFVAGTVHGFPNIILAILLIGFTAAMNFIDIKDYEGDKKAGIKTVPVLLGLKKAKLFTGLFFILTYSSFYFIAKDLLIPAILLGVVQFYLINRKDYNEKHVFLVYSFSLLVLLFYFLLLNQ